MTTSNFGGAQPPLIEKWGAQAPPAPQVLCLCTYRTYSRDIASTGLRARAALKNLGNLKCNIGIETRLGHRHAIYINVLKGMLMYIACLCPNLISVHFYAIPILHFKFPNFEIYL